MSRESIIEWYNAHKGKGITKSLCSKHNKDILTEVYALTPTLDDSFTILTRLYWIVNGITEFPKCKVCGKELRRNISCMRNRYADICSDACRSVSLKGMNKGIPNDVRIALLAEKNENKRKVEEVQRNLKDNGDSIILRCGLEVSGLSNVNHDQKVHYLVYKMVNKVNGHYYIGRHTTINPMDDYWGSGVALTAALKKYGIASFRKEILGDYRSYEESCRAEAFLVPEERCHNNNPECYNLTSGGKGGGGSEVGKKCAATRKAHGYRHSLETRRRQSERAKGIPKSEAHKRSLSLHHRTRRLYHVLFENGIVKEIEGTIPSIAKEHGISRALQLRRYSQRGDFYHGIRLLDVVKPEEEYYHKLSKSDALYNDPITGESTSWNMLRSRKRNDTRYQSIGRIEDYVKEEFKFNKGVAK